MWRTKRTSHSHADHREPPFAGDARSGISRALNLRARNRPIESRWAPDIESDLNNETPISPAELQTIRQLLGDDLNRLLDDKTNSP